MSLQRTHGTVPVRSHVGRHVEVNTSVPVPDESKSGSSEIACCYRTLVLFIMSVPYTKYGKEIAKRNIEMLELNERIENAKKKGKEILETIRCWKSYEAGVVPAGFTKVMVTVRCKSKIFWTQPRILPLGCFSTDSCVASFVTNQQAVEDRAEQQSVGDDEDDGKSESVRQSESNKYEGLMPVSAAAYTNWRKSNILMDSDENLDRGVWIMLQSSDECKLLHLLHQIYAHFEPKMGKVQSYSKHLLHYNFSDPGLPVIQGAMPVYVQEMEKLLSTKIRQALIRIGYCSEDQEIQLYLSFLKTLETEIQPPHIDYQWKDISPQDFKKRPRSYTGNYKDWVPFIALFPLTQDGMTVEVWNARAKHDLPECNEGLKGVLVNIHFGEMLLLRADVVHAGGFATAASGNPRGHFYIYKTPRGAAHSYPLSNCYDVEWKGKTVPLMNYYKHCNGPTFTAETNKK